MSETLVKNYYTGYVRKEWRRLIKDAYHRLEFETTLHFLKKHFPKKGLLLDAGGGPGRYTVTLAQQGYQMVLLDMTPANLDFARWQIKRAKLTDKVTGIVEGSIVDLSRFADNTFDGVLCLGGPLSHVLHGLAEVRMMQDDYAAALPLFRESLNIRQRLGNRPEIVNTLGAIAMAYFYLNDAITATRLIAASERLRAEIGMVIQPSSRTEIDDNIAQVRDQAAAAFEAAWAAGQAMSVDEAVRLALTG